MPKTERAEQVRIERGDEIVVDARGLGVGRWIYCKYCYKNVLPECSTGYDGISFQIVCGECGYGLTPSCPSRQAMRDWFNGDMDAPYRDE